MEILAVTIRNQRHQITLKLLRNAIFDSFYNPKDKIASKIFSKLGESVWAKESRPVVIHKNLLIFSLGKSSSSNYLVKIPR